MVAVIVLLLGGAACGDDDAGSGGDGGDVTVFAAASLTEAFTELGGVYEIDHPGAEVTFNFSSSSDLVTQINEGAPADVYASADPDNMAKLTDADGAKGEPHVFATNRLEIIVESDNPERITSLEDLADPDLIVLLGAPEVPVGKYAAEVLDVAGVSVTARSLEEDVKAVVQKVRLGEADAGIVYVTDVRAAGNNAEGVEIPDDVNIAAEYPITVIADAPNAEGAAAFVDLVLSAEGQELLHTYGFTEP